MSKGCSSKPKKTSLTSVKKKRKPKHMDPIDSWNVFSTDESSYSESNTLPIRATDNLESNNDSDQDDFLPKFQTVRKVLPSTRKIKSNTVLKTPPKKVSCILNENKEPSSPKLNTITKTTPKIVPLISNEDKELSSSNSNSPSKSLIQMRLNSPNKKSPNSAQKIPKINIISSTIIQKPNQDSATQKLQTESNVMKKSVCRNIFGNENSNKSINKKNTILNITISDKTSIGTIEISDKKNLINIDLTINENEDESSCSELKTAKKLNHANTANKQIIQKETDTKIVETPARSSKKIKSKDLKNYTQSTLLSFMRNTKPVAKNDAEINKNKSKNNIVKVNSKYTVETNTRVYENVRNFMEWVFENDNFKILFTKDETDVLDNFFRLSDTKLTILCLRLFTRQHKWYNLSNLCTELNLKDDSYNFHHVLTHLKEHYVYSDYSNENVNILLNHLTAIDLKEICNSFKIIAPSKKDAMLKKLLDYTSKQCTLTFVKNSDQILRERVSEKLGICVKLKTDFKNILYRIHLLYTLAHPELKNINDIYNMVNRIKSNEIKYPDVEIDSTEIFADRQDFLNYAEATLLQKEYEDQFIKKDIGSQYLLGVEAHKRFMRLLNDTQQVKFDNLKPLFLRRFSASWVYCKVLSSCSLNLGKYYSEKICKWLTDMLDQETYCVYKRGQWYIQLSMINQTHLKKFVEAADFIIKGINDRHVNEVGKYELSIRGSKMKKTKLPQLKFDELQYALQPKISVPVEITFEAKAVHWNEQGRKLHFERITDEGKEYGSVEETAIYYYKEHYNYTDGCHCEGRLLTTLFIIFFWDILYEMNVPNTFINEMQSFPLDLFSTDFYTNRHDKITERLNDIRNKWNLDEICRFFTSKFSTHTLEINSVVHFQCDNETFHVIIRSIGKNVLTAVFERLAKDYKQFHSGLPDLFLWNNTDFKCAFVEVKSEKDILSTKQILWINYLHQFNACVQVCHVLNKGSNKSKKKM